MASNPSTVSRDPWRYRCPECDSTHVRTNVMDDQSARKADHKHVCRRCDWQGDELLDKKTGRMV